jgi:hypothetical protein
LSLRMDRNDFASGETTGLFFLILNMSDHLMP